MRPLQQRTDLTTDHTFVVVPCVCVCVCVCVCAEDRPSCKEIVERICSIIQGVCPEISSYDAQAEAAFAAKLQQDVQRRQQRDKLKQKQQTYVPCHHTRNARMHARTHARTHTHTHTS
jgi:hypothetical protein